MANLHYILLIALDVVMGFTIAATQSRLNARAGTDHAVHKFLIRAIQANRFRLFTRIPGLLNKTHCAALPLYLHWVFAHFGQRVMRRAEWLLNPVVNAVLVILCAQIAAMVAFQLELGRSFVPAAAAAFALTPQFYHALSARNFGLSARGIGLFLLALVFSLAYCVASGVLGITGWVALAVAAYLLWAFSTFAGQALTILGVLALVCFGHWTPLAGGAMGLALFLAIHPRYGASYLYHTLRFIRGYATELAPVYILARRFSIWRDLIWDIWRRIAANPTQGLRYAYENSALIVLGLNPLLGLTVIGWASHMLPRQGALGYATDIALCGALASLLTSFRLTRFLGEPERYAEAVTPFAAAAGAAVLALWGGVPAIVAALALFAVADCAQLYASHMLGRYVAANSVDLGAAAAIVDQNAVEPVRCAGNNDQIIKQLLPNDWQFVFCMAIGSVHCGIPIGEVFSTYPFVRREALQHIVREMRVNVLFLDRSLYSTLFDVPPAGLRATRILQDTESLRILAFDWEPAAGGQDQ